MFPIYEIIKFIIVAIIIFLITYIGIIMKDSHKFSPLITSIIITLIIAIIIIAYQSRNTKDSFSFKVSDPKLCEGGPYMISSASPEIKKYCQQLWSTPEGLNKYYSMNCPNGFNGRPVKFEYTPESNDFWENPRCDGENEYGISVL